uniref:Uncharacterized protein n=1 Tax=Cannabis sativa TaxID=3483 RepID=A0A803P5R1_CANSA
MLKDCELLKKQNLALQEDFKKIKLNIANKEKEIKDIGKAKGKVEKKIKELEDQVTALTRDLSKEKEEKKKPYD